MASYLLNLIYFLLKLRMSGKDITLGVKKQWEIAHVEKNGVGSAVKKICGLTDVIIPKLKF